MMGAIGSGAAAAATCAVCTSLPASLAGAADAACAGASALASAAFAAPPSRFATGWPCKSCRLMRPFSCTITRAKKSLSVVSCTSSVSGLPGTRSTATPLSARAFQFSRSCASRPVARPLSCAASALAAASRTRTSSRPRLPLTDAVGPLSPISSLTSPLKLPSARTRRIFKSLGR
ncbi:hypothetical protein SDC9_108547 [bioreactor metagenome]|uniref:Uncharacterized protein n=1 Tax=bioreactor metagenome TaxID=1076179 RepID=A0A645B8G3_9ZZZZ